MSGHTHLRSDHSRSSITPPTPPHPTRSAEWDDAAMVLVGMLSASASYSFLNMLILFTSPSMLRRLWTKDWTGIVATLGISWAYAVTALSVNPDYVHGLWLVYFRVMLPTWVYFVDAMAVFSHLRMHPKFYSLFFGTQSVTYKAGNQKNSWLIVFVMSALFVLLAIDIARHYLLVQLSKDVNLVALNITNPFNKRPVAFNNVDLATALFWTATIFMAQSFWVMLSKKVFQVTITDKTNYEIVLETSGDDVE